MSDCINQYEPSSLRFKQGLEKLLKGAEAQATLAQELQREFDRTEAKRAMRGIMGLVVVHRLPVSFLLIKSKK